MALRTLTYRVVSFPFSFVRACTERRWPPIDRCAFLYRLMKRRETYEIAIPPRAHVLSSFHTHYFMRKSGYETAGRFMKRVQRSVIRASSNSSVLSLLSFFFPFPCCLSLFSFFSSLFSLTVRTTVYILSPMQHARVSDYSKTAHVPGGSGSQPTHLHSCLSLSIALFCVLHTYTRDGKAQA